MTLTHGSLFTGYGGLDMAVEAALGAMTVWHCEYEPPTQKVPDPKQAAAHLLAYRWPSVPNHGDVTALDWRSVEPVDVISGGSPCQDVSDAGRRAGMRAGTRSGLWASMVDAIDIIRPALVVWENVRGVLSADADSAVEPCPGCVGDGPDGSVLRALGRVLGDLADIGYDASWHGLPASDIGAPHGRFRVFVVAWPAADAVGAGLEGGWTGGHGAQRPSPVGNHDVAADTDGGGRRTRVQDLHAGQPDVAWGSYEPAIRRWERLTRPAPLPWERGAKGGYRLAPAFSEWMMGLPAGHVTDVPGLTRNEQLNLLGNGVVPQQAAVGIREALRFAPDRVLASLSRPAVSA